MLAEKNDFSSVNSREEKHQLFKTLDPTQL